MTGSDYWKERMQTSLLPARLTLGPSPKHWWEFADHPPRGVCVEHRLSLSTEPRRPQWMSLQSAKGHRTRDMLIWEL